MELDRIGRYEIQSRLGTGGMGSLYLARDPSLDRLVAIKLLKDDYQDDKDLRERFAREARSVAQLRHPNIIIVFDVGEHQGRPFMAMEYIAGETLASVLRQSPPLPIVRRLSLIEDLCAGLAHAHSAGIIHRDIKPANIMLDSDGVLKILDFGIARLANSGMTQDGMMMGSVNYMSPEQIIGRGVDRRTDIFATGAVLYEAIALQQAFPGGIDTGVLHSILDKGPVPLDQRVPGVDPDLVVIVRHALEREPELRYQDANVMRRDIARVRRRLLDEGYESGAAPPDQTIVSRSKTAPSRAGRQSDSDRGRRKLDPERLAEVRRQQVEEHLRFSREALSKGDHDVALQHAERAASVDPENRVAFELIEKARFAIEAKAIRQLLAEANRLLSEGHVEDASALAEEASVTLPDLPEASELRGEVRRMADQIATLREREHRIGSSLQRAKTSIEQGGFETALRAVYEVLALDPERPEARELEQIAKSRLHAQREHEQLRRSAYDRLKSARSLASEGRYEEAADVINAVIPPSETVRLASAEALAAVRTLQRQAAYEAIVAEAEAAFNEDRLEQALTAIESIPVEERTEKARQLRIAVEESRRKRRELEQRRQALEKALGSAQALIDSGDLANALERVEDAVRTGLDDERIGSLRKRIADLAVAAQEKRRQEARDRLAAKKVEAARQLFANGDGYAAVALLERDGSGHALVEATLTEMRATLAEQEDRVRQEAERRRQEQEARRQAEMEAARRLEEERKAAEKRRRDEDRRLEAERKAAEEAAAKRLLEEQRRQHELEQHRRRAEVTRLVSAAEEALNIDRLGDASNILTQADAVGAVEEDADLMRRLRAIKAETERRQQIRRELEKHLVLARERLSQGRLDIASDAAAAALALDSTHAPALALRDEIDREVARRAAEATRQEEIRQREEEARRRAEEARHVEQQIDTIVAKARKVNAHEAALDLLSQALTLAPGDPRLQTLIGERQAALESQRASEQRRREINAAVAAIASALERGQSDEAERLIVDAEQQYGASSVEKVRLALADRRRIDARQKADAEEAARRERERVAREERARRAREEKEAHARRAREEKEERARREREEKERRARLEREAETAREIEQEAQRQQAMAPTATTAAAVEQFAEPTVLRPATEPTVLRPSEPRVLQGPHGPARFRRATIWYVAAAAVVLMGGAAGIFLLRSPAAEPAELSTQPVSAPPVGQITPAPPVVPTPSTSSTEKEPPPPVPPSVPKLPPQGTVSPPVVTVQPNVGGGSAGRSGEQQRPSEGRNESPPRDLPGSPPPSEAIGGPPVASKPSTVTVPVDRPEQISPPAPRPAPQNPPPPLQPVDERAAIEQTLRAYEAAWASRDPNSLSRLQTLSGDGFAAVRNSMDSAREIEVSVQVQNVALADDSRHATVTARVRRRFVPKSAARTSDIVANNVFTMEKRGEMWVIVALR